MSISFELEQPINAPPALVFDALTRIEAWPGWMPDLVSAEKLTEGPFGVGTRWREVRRLLGKETTEFFEVTAAVPDERIELYVDASKGSTGKGDLRFVQSLQPRGNGTLLTLRGEASGLGLFGKVVGRLLKGTLKKAMCRDLEALRAHVEAQI